MPSSTPWSAGTHRWGGSRGGSPEMGEGGGGGDGKRDTQVGEVGGDGRQDTQLGGCEGGGGGWQEAGKRRGPALEVRPQPCVRTATLILLSHTIPTSCVGDVLLDHAAALPD